MLGYQIQWPRKQQKRQALCASVLSHQERFQPLQQSALPTGA